MLITCYRPNLVREQATGMLRQSFREMRYGQLRLVMDFYLPYRLFSATLGDGKRSRDLLMAVDAVTGRLDPYVFDERPHGEQLMQIDASRIARESVLENQSLKLLKERLTREAFLKGFFKLAELTISAEQIASFYFPFWVGAYERNERADLEVIDAVRGRFEGEKLREVVREWFERK